mmetsp:Transcript_22537/g.50774  ORF Transcript_22537/g.50774 Transcript_22537/m.50774 type:complete len:231 (+) Transcript_22537:393-1085(+)
MLCHVQPRIRHFLTAHDVHPILCGSCLHNPLWPAVAPVLHIIRCPPWLLLVVELLRPWIPDRMLPWPTDVSPSPITTPKVQVLTLNIKFGNNITSQGIHPPARKALRSPVYHCGRRGLIRCRGQMRDQRMLLLDALTEIFGKDLCINNAMFPEILLCSCPVPAYYDNLAALTCGSVLLLCSATVYSGQSQSRTVLNIGIWNLTVLEEEQRRYCGNSGKVVVDNSSCVWQA